MQSGCQPAWRTTRRRMRRLSETLQVGKGDRRRGSLRQPPVPEFASPPRIPAVGKTTGFRCCGVERGVEAFGIVSIRLVGIEIGGVEELVMESGRECLYRREARRHLGSGILGREVHDLAPAPVEDLPRLLGGDLTAKEPTYGGEGIRRGPLVGITPPPQRENALRAG